MTLVSSCKSKLVCFRIKELKDILTQLGLSKQGRKQDLLDRILGLLTDEEVSNARGSSKNFIGKEAVAKLIDDVFRKMNIADASDLATKGQSDLELCNAKLKEEAEDSSNSPVKVSCPCGNSSPTDAMIKCVDPTCQVQQHVNCVMLGIQQIPPIFHCEKCRIKRADPFWVTMAHLISPVKLIAVSVPSDGASPVLNVEKTFQLKMAEIDLMQYTEYDIQAWCVLLNDKVPFRMQWPLHADLQVNGLQVRTVNRPVSQLLGANGRDDGALVKLYLREEINKISLSASDTRSFCFGLRLVKRRTVAQVLSLIPKERDGEHFEGALARVRRCIGGGMATANEDSDSDLEVITDTVTISLRCPMSGSRMKVAGRFKPCIHMGCFNLETFVELNQRSRKWQCPICLKNYSLEDIIIDPYFNRITQMVQHCGEDVTEIDVKPDGSWTVKTKGELGDLGQWHLPDGSLCGATSEHISISESLRQIKKEESSGNTNPNGIIESSKHPHPFFRNQLEETLENYDKGITMSSSASGSGRDNEDQSINLDFEQIDISTNDGDQMNSTHNLDRTFETENQSSGPMMDLDIIVLSDSEEENINFFPSQTVYKSCPTSDSGVFSNPPLTGNSFLENPTLVSGLESDMGHINSNANDGMSNWLYPSVNQAGLGFQLFATDPDVSDVFVDLEQSSVTCSMPMNGYSSVSKPIISSGAEVHDASIYHINNAEDNDLANSTFAFVPEDPSLQNFLPTQPVTVLKESELELQPPISNDIQTEDWVSLRLGSNDESVGTDVGSFAQSASMLEQDLVDQCESNKATITTNKNNETRSNGMNSRMFDGPFSFPRQRRSVRRRVYFVDSDSN